jgi:hypothetical protein
MLAPEGLTRLRQAAVAAAAHFGGTAEGVFDPCGLILFRPEEKYPYWCTPANVVTFATTGGDGVHYSYLPSAAGASVCPVVMTVPMAAAEPRECNVVIAESFDEFFCLGYFVGWFSLEQLVYDRASALAYFSAPDPDHDDEWCLPRLAFIRQALKIKPGPPHEARLSELEAKYLDRLVFPESQSAA